MKSFKVENFHEERVEVKHLKKAENHSKKIFLQKTL